MNRRRKEVRKGRQLIKWILFFGSLLIWVIPVFCIINIYAHLEEIQMELKWLKMQQYGAAWVSQEVQMSEETEYVGSIGSWVMEKPAERSEEEIMQRLGELGQVSPVIEDIYQNHSLYPNELLAALANNPEMVDFVSGYPDGDGVTGGITVSEKEQEYPLLLQWDPRWGYEPYGESCIGLAGCGPTCLSMVLYYLTGDETLTPDKIAAYSTKNGYYAEGTGTAWVLMQDLPRLYGVKVTEISSSESSIKAALDNGSIIICAMGRGDFTISGHYIVIYGFDEDGFMVNDPNCVARSSRRWTFGEIQYQIKNIWAYHKEK